LRRATKDAGDNRNQTNNERNKTMPLAQIKGISGLLSQPQKEELISKITDAIVSVEGEGIRPVTWVILEDVNSGSWGVGGKALTTDDVRALAANG
jgi:4-oxalocrotonate tautomerase